MKLDVCIWIVFVTRFSWFFTVILCPYNFDGSVISIDIPTEVAKTLFSILNEPTAEACRWFLKEHYNFSDIQILIRGLQMMIEKCDAEKSKLLASSIIEIFVKSKLDTDEDLMAEIYDLWLGFYCNCNNDAAKTSLFCSSDLVLVAVAKRRLDDRIFDDFKVKVVQVNMNSIDNTEAKAVTDEVYKLVDRSSLVRSHVPGTLAEKLFNDHSKLTIVCSSFVKSSKQAKKTNFTQCPCVQLYCQVKGIIPVGEKHFPIAIQGMPTDVLEGIPQFTTNTIRIGDSITNTKSTGTLGGFCCRYGVDAFLTCAHVVMDWDTLQSPSKKFNKERQNVYIPGEGILDKSVYCGRVTKHTFNYDRPSEVSTDAALVEINDQECEIKEDDIVKTDGSTQIHKRDLGLESRHIEDSYITHYLSLIGKKIQTVAVGSVSKKWTPNPDSQVHMLEMEEIGRENMQSAANRQAKEIVKSYAHLGGVDVNLQVHVENIVKQSRAEERSHRSLRFYNQMRVDGIPFVNGDSGTCVYIAGNNQETGCLGMAIADFPGGGCIVTPISILLKELEIVNRLT